MKGVWKYVTFQSDDEGGGQLRFIEHGVVCAHLFLRMATWYLLS